MEKLKIGYCIQGNPQIKTGSEVGQQNAQRKKNDSKDIRGTESSSSRYAGGSFPGKSCPPFDFQSTDA